MQENADMIIIKQHLTQLSALEDVTELSPWSLQDVHLFSITWTLHKILYSGSKVVFANSASHH